MNTIGERTKILRKTLNLKQKDLSLITGMSQGSISDIENNQKNYSFEAIISLMRYLRDKSISIDWLLTGEDRIHKNISLIDSINADEVELLENYRKLGTNFQERVLERAKAFVEAKEEMYNSMKNPLNMYIKKIPSLDGEIRIQVDIKVFDLPASAGFGNYLEGESPYDMLCYDADDIPHGTNFGIRISGDSMEPDIENGSVVWVKDQVRVEDGDIGIFILDGEAYCKKLSVDYMKKEVQLISLNKNYAPIIIKEHNDLRTVGKVLM